MDVMTQTLGGLRCRVVQRDTKAPTMLAVLCHGYGASGGDLVQLAELLAEASPAAAATRYIFPEGLIDLAKLGAPTGRAWWDLDLEHLLQRGKAGPDAWATLRDHRFAGAPAARRALTACIDLSLRQVGLGYDRLILGGFSQGAMLACEVAWRLDEAPRALGILSGTLIDQSRWRSLLSRRAGLRIVQSHGRQDLVLPFAGAEALLALLREAGCEVTFVPFEGGHTIIPAALAALAKAF